MEPATGAWETVSWSDAHGREMSGKPVCARGNMNRAEESHDSSPMSFGGFV